MACAAAVSAGAIIVKTPGLAVAGLGESRLLSRQSVVLGAPRTSFSAKSLVCNNRSRVTMSASSQKEGPVAGLTTLALIAAAVVPEIAEAATPGVSPSLKNLLLSVVAGGVIATILGVAVAGVSTFDPVKRR